MKQYLIKIKDKLQAFFALPFFRDFRTILVLWIILAIVDSVLKYQKSDNNFLIYRYVFWHAIEQLPLYIHYPLEFDDLNHYGPVFAYVIAPFAVMPHFLGLLFWNLSLALFLYVAIRRFPFTRYQQLFIMWFCTHDLLLCMMMQQFNIAVAAIIVIAFCLIESERDFTAAFFIMLGTFVKLLGIVALPFFFFSKHKQRLFWALLFWAVIMFVAPMLITSPQYIVNCYGEWYQALIDKNATNTLVWGAYDSMNNISTLGMVRRILNTPNYSDLWVLLPGLLLMAVAYFRVPQWKHLAFRETVLAAVLMFSVLFSTGSESTSFIIAFVGIGLWFVAVPWERSRFDIFLMVFAFLLGSLGASDLYPKAIREGFIHAYGLKALPCTIIWLKMCYEMLTRDYKNPQYDTVQQTI